MKRLLLALVIALVIAPTPVLADVTGGVTVTAEPTFMGISVAPDAYDFGLVGENGTYSTKDGYFTATNTGSVMCDLSISGVDMTGGLETWTLDPTGTPGVSTYGMMSRLEGGVFDVIVAPSPGNTLRDELLRQTSQDFDLQLLAPTSGIGLEAMSGYVTVTATEAATVAYSHDDTTGIIFVNDCWREGPSQLHVNWDSLGGSSYSMLVTNNGIPLLNEVPGESILQPEVAASSDDALRRLVSDMFNLTDVLLVAGYTNGTENMWGAGMGFVADVPQGATILEAYLILTSGVSQAPVPVLTRISAEDVDDAPTFADDAAVFDARYANSTAQIDWDINEAWVIDVSYQSPDITSIIQVVVDRPGFVSGNNIVLFWEDFDNRSSGDGTDRRVHSADNTGTAPVLYLKFVPFAKAFDTTPGIFQETWLGDVSGEPVILIITATIP